MRGWKYITILVVSTVLLCFFPVSREVRAAEEDEKEDVRTQYEAYKGRLDAVETGADIAANGFTVVESQIFAIPLIKEETQEDGSGTQLESADGREMADESERVSGNTDGEESGIEDENAVIMIPAFDEEYNRLVLFFTDVNGTVLYKTDQLEMNTYVRGQMKQPRQEIAAVSFQDLNQDKKTDIIIITSCISDTGKTYKVGDVLFQSGEELGFYRDYRIADKVNRFGMNKSAESIAEFVKGVRSTEFLYTATTLRTLQQHGFHIITEQCYFRTFGKLGKLQVVPGTYRIADYDIFMIYLVNEEGYIVSSLQPMGEYDNLYALKGVSCRDIDGDGLKDIIVLARYSYEGEGGQLITESDYRIYYQRTGGFSADTEINGWYQCSDEDTMEALVEKARSYWGWKTEDE